MLFSLCSPFQLVFILKFLCRCWAYNLRFAFVTLKTLTTMIHRAPPSQHCSFQHESLPRLWDEPGFKPAEIRTTRQRAMLKTAGMRETDNLHSEEQERESEREAHKQVEHHSRANCFFVFLSVAVLTTHCRVILQTNVLADSDLTLWGLENTFTNSWDWDTNLT